MSHGYRAVGWNRQKKIYDTTLIAGVIAYLAVFMGVGFARHPEAGLETLGIRALGTAAFVLLHIILSIGPLCRLDRRWLPLLYNRRHMGVTMFVLALLHGLIGLSWYHGFGNLNPLVSMLTANTNVASLSQFPFQPFGFFALVILFLMAATSHDFWLANLTPPVWKTLHMLVYVAYGLLVAHVALGYLQTETHPASTVVMGVGLVWICAIHVIAASKEAPRDRPADVSAPDGEGYVPIGPVDGIEEGRGHTVCLAGDRIAVFRYDGKISAISNACQHQNGPLGEGRIIDGLVTCPWHGFQYDPADGASPPPFTEKVPTFHVKVVNGEIWIHPTPEPPGTRIEPAVIAGADGGPA